jgi:hypothetical protein
MPSGRRRSLRDQPALTAVAVGSMLLLAGALIWFLPYLTEGRRSVAEIPSPPALKTVSEFALAPGQQACMSYLAVTPNSRVAKFRVRAVTARGGPPIELRLSAFRYETRAHLAGGYTTGGATLPIVAPSHALLGEACFVNRGKVTALLDGTTEPRTVSRSATRIDGRPVVGDIAIEFLDTRRPSLLDRTGEMFGHVANLTDNLVPVWLIWVLAVLVVLGVPIGTMAAFYAAIEEDDAASAT